MTKGHPIRAVLASEFWAGATARGIVPGLREAGWLIDEVDMRAHLSAAMTLAGRVEARLQHRTRISRFQHAILRSARLHAADVFITVKGSVVQPATIDALRAEGVFTVNYYPDYHFNDVPIETVARYDLVATTKSFQLGALTAHMPAERVAFLHHGYSAEFHHPLAENAIKQDVDLLYIGNAGAEKAALLVAVAEALPDLRIRVVGGGWRKFARGTALEPAVVGHALSGDYFAAEVARARINLAFHMGRDRATGFADLVSTRTFEIPACGGFMLHVDNDEVRSLFDVPGEIDTFVSPADLLEKIRYWLANPVEREAVAARGHARAVPAYSYVERGKALAQLVEQRLAASSR